MGFFVLGELQNSKGVITADIYYLNNLEINNPPAIFSHTINPDSRNIFQNSGNKNIRIPYLRNCTPLSLFTQNT